MAGFTTTKLHCALQGGHKIVSPGKWTWQQKMEKAIHTHRHTYLLRTLLQRLTFISWRLTTTINVTITCLTLTTDPIISYFPIGDRFCPQLHQLSPFNWSLVWNVSRKVAQVIPRDIVDTYTQTHIQIFALLQIILYAFGWWRYPLVHGCTHGETQWSTIPFVSWFPSHTLHTMQTRFPL